MTNSKPLTSSAAAFPASLSAQPAGKKAHQTNVGFGPNSSAYSKPSDQDGCLLRTCLVCEQEGWMLFDMASLDWGIEAARPSSPLAQLVPHIHEIDCSLWVTPTARDWKGYTKRKGESICNQLQRLYGRIGKPNPCWTEWLMGFPDKWTDLEDSEMPSSRKSRSG